MHESRPNKILDEKVFTVHQETGMSNIRIDDPDPTPDARPFLCNSISRPARLFFHQHLVMSKCLVLQPHLSYYNNHT